jgi:DNA-binding MarR family transcriptional regulator
MSISETSTRSASSATDLLDRQPATEDRAFFIMRVSELNVLLKRRAEIYARRNFGFKLLEWRIIMLLTTKQPQSLSELALQALVDLAQASRAVSKLEAKGYVARARSPDDNRVLQVTLSKKGLALSDEICQASRERNEQLLRGNSPKEVRFLNTALDALIMRARFLLEEDSAEEKEERGGGR